MLTLDCYVELRETIIMGDNAKKVLERYIKEVWNKIYKYSKPFLALEGVDYEAPYFINSNMIFFDFAFTSNFTKIELEFRDSYDDYQYVEFPVHWLYSIDDEIKMGVEKQWNEYIGTLKKISEENDKKKEQHEKELYEKLKNKYGGVK